MYKLFNGLIGVTCTKQVTPLWGRGVYCLGNTRVCVTAENRKSLPQLIKVTYLETTAQRPQVLHMKGLIHVIE